MSDPTRNERALQNVEAIQIGIDTENANAIRDYNSLQNNWKINKGLREAATPPLPPESEPAVKVKSLNHSLAIQIYLAWDARVAARRQEGADIPGQPLGDEAPNYAAAITESLYVPPSGAPGPVNVYVSDLVGPLIAGSLMRRRSLGSAFAGKTRLGEVAIGPDGLTYKLVDSGSPFNRTGEWQPV